MRRLDASGLRVSRLGLGLAALGRPGYINVGHGEDLGEERSVAAMEARTHRMLDEALRGGVRYFDAARSYGRAEAFLGSWLQERNLPPDGVAVGSKWGYVYTAGWRVEADTHEVKEHSLSLLRKQWRESRTALGPYLRLYQIHSVTPDSGVLDDRQVLVELSGLKREGVRIGLSSSGPGQAEVISRAAGLEVDGVRLFDSVQATWNLLERSAGPALQEAHASGMAVILKEALANGRLTSRNREPALTAAAGRLRTQAQRPDASLDTLALAAALARPWADVVLSGATTVPQLRSNLRALELEWDEALHDVAASLTENPEAYWRHRKGLPWT